MSITAIARKITVMIAPCFQIVFRGISSWPHQEGMCLVGWKDTINGPDAIIVMHPPRRAANPIGIIRRETGIRACFPILITAGRKRAATPIVCITEKKRPTVIPMAQPVPV